MWFAFGFITLITFSIFFGYRRLRASWKGIQAETDGISWQYELCKDNYRVTDVLIGIEAPKGYEFSFKHERWYDRLCKAIGLSVEYQVGNAEFDDLVYIVSDDNHLHRQVSANPTIVDAVLRIFRLDAVRHQSKVEALHCSSGRLWLRIDARRGFEEGNVAALGREVVPWMQKISDALSSAPTSGDSKWRDAFVMKAAVILAISSGLAINGGVHVMRLIWTKIPFTIDSTALLMDALVIGALVIVALVVATVLVLGGSARAHLVLIEILVVGSFGAMATALTELRDAYRTRSICCRDLSGEDSGEASRAYASLAPLLPLCGGLEWRRTEKEGRGPAQLLLPGLYRGAARHPSETRVFGIPLGGSARETGSVSVLAVMLFSLRRGGRSRAVRKASILDAGRITRGRSPALVTQLTVDARMPFASILDVYGGQRGATRRSVYALSKARCMASSSCPVSVNSS